MHRADGTPFWCKLKARLLDIAKPALGVAWVAEDIDLHRRGEQQLALYRTLIEFTSDCVLCDQSAAGISDDFRQ